MKADKSTSVARAGQGLLRSVGAVLVGVVAGFVVVLLLDAILPHGKEWQLPTIFLCAFGAGAYVGLACMRPPPRMSSREPPKNPHDAE
jgi:hypothetical protein